MRNPRRQSGPIKRTIVTLPVPSDRPASNLAIRSTAVAPLRSGARRKSHAVSMATAQRDSRGYPSDWGRTYNLRPTSTPMTAAWSRTAYRNRPDQGIAVDRDLTANQRRP